MQIRITNCTLLTLAILLPACGSDIENSGEWTHFRGSDLNGIVEGSDYPLHWSESENIAWKAEIIGKGWSSPVVCDNQVWCTTASLDGNEMYAVCTDLKSGENLFTIEVLRPDTIYRIHSINSYATPSPCIEKGFVYVHFGRYGTACIETRTGNIVWKREDLHCRHVQGPGSSPVLYKDVLILHFDGTDEMYLIALDKRTGNTVWKTERPPEPYEPLRPIQKKAYITPLIIQVDGRDLLVSNGSAVCIAYEPGTGNEVWRVVKGAESTVAMPVEGGGLVYFYTGYEVSPEGEKYSEFMAVDPDGKGNITSTNVSWRLKSPPMQLSTPVIKDGLVYTIDSRARFMCLDAATGEVVWSEQLKGKFNSSLIWANGHIYYSSTNGETTVIQDGREFEVIAENQLEGEIWTTPAFVEGSILLRTSKAIYKIHKQ